MTDRRDGWRGPAGEPWFPRDLIVEGGCPFTESSPFTPLYHELPEVPASA